MSISLTVFFEDPFWVGVFCLIENERARYCRVVFGGEPSDTEIYYYFHTHWRNLQFSAARPALPAEPQIKNPKRRQRAINRILQKQSGQNRSYAIIKQTWQGELKESRQSAQRLLEAQHEEYVLRIKQAKRKEKHRGR